MSVPPCLPVCRRCCHADRWPWLSGSCWKACPGVAAEHSRLTGRQVRVCALARLSDDCADTGRVSVIFCARLGDRCAGWWGAGRWGRQRRRAAPVILGRWHKEVGPQKRPRGDQRWRGTGLSSSVGGISHWILRPISASIGGRAKASSSPAKLIEVPLAPARPVRPIRCT